MVINEFFNGFYRFWNTENDIRVMAKKYPNTYSLAIYACCREIYSASRHTGLFGGTKESAVLHFTQLLTSEFLAKESSLEAGVKEMAVKQVNDHRDEILNQIKA